MLRPCSLERAQPRLACRCVPRHRRRARSRAARLPRDVARLRAVGRRDGRASRARRRSPRALSRWMPRASPLALAVVRSRRRLACGPLLVLVNPVIPLHGGSPTASCAEIPGPPAHGDGGNRGLAAVRSSSCCARRHPSCSAWIGVGAVDVDRGTGAHRRRGLPAASVPWLGWAGGWSGRREAVLALERAWSSSWCVVTRSTWRGIALRGAAVVTVSGVSWRTRRYGG